MGIEVTTTAPWIVQTFTYPHATVRLHFFRVTDWRGERIRMKGNLCLARVR